MLDQIEAQLMVMEVAHQHMQWGKSQAVDYATRVSTRLENTEVVQTPDPHESTEDTGSSALVPDTSSNLNSLVHFSSEPLPH